MLVPARRERQVDEVDHDGGNTKHCYRIARSRSCFPHDIGVTHGCS